MIFRPNFIGYVKYSLKFKHSEERIEKSNINLFVLWVNDCLRVKAASKWAKVSSKSSRNLRLPGEISTTITSQMLFQ